MKLQSFIRGIFSVGVLATALMVGVTEKAQAQPAVRYRIQTLSNGSGVSPYSTVTLVEGTGWTQNISGGSAGVSYSKDYSGSQSGNTLTLTCSSSQSGQRTASGQIQATASYHPIAYVKGKVSATVSPSTSAAVSTTGTSTNARYAGVYHMPFNDDSLSIGTISGPATINYSGTFGAAVTFNKSCNESGAYYFSDYPTVAYYAIALDDLSCSTLEAVGFNGTVDSDATLTVNITIGSDAPTAIADGPYVSSVSKPHPDIGDVVTFNNLSNDPDNNDATVRAGICTAAWLITFPDGVTTQSSSNLTSASFTASQPGNYNIQLTVTDNEGVQSVDTKEVLVGSFRDTCDHCDSPKEPVACSDDTEQFSSNPSTGDVLFTRSDPITTRGYPLRNNLHIKTRTKVTLPSSPFGNATFSYGIRVADLVVNSVSHRFVIDGNGKVLDFGPSAGSPTAEAGVYSTLTVLGGGGYQLSSAGAPESIAKADNFTYDFDSTGLLTQITDDAGNTQTLSYSSGLITEVLDTNTGKVLTFEYDSGSSYVNRVVENNGDAVTHLTYTSGRITSITLKDGSGTTVRSSTISYTGAGLPDQYVRDGDTNSTITYTYKDRGDGVMLANLTWAGGGTNYNYFGAPVSGATWRTIKANDKGGTTKYDYDSSGNLKRLEYPTMNGASGALVYTTTHDANNNLTQVSDGRTTLTYTYDALGQVTEVQDNLSNAVNYTYSGVNLTQIDDAIGTLLELGYTDMAQPNRVTSITDGAGNEWTKSYNAYGQATTLTPPTGAPLGAITYTYDETALSPSLGKLLSIVNGEGDTVTLSNYTDMNDVGAVTTSPGASVYHTSNLSYDAAQRVTEVEHPDGNAETFTYSGRDLVGYEDEAGSVTSYTYCASCGKLTGIDEPLSRSLAWTLDDDFDTTLFTDPRGGETIYRYGLARELKEVEHEDGSKYQYEYNQYGDVAKIKQPKSATKLTLSYDAVGRLDTAVQSSTTLQDFSYNADNTVASVANSSAAAAYTYTDDRRVESVEYNFAGVGLTNHQFVEYTYNTEGSVASITWKNNTTTVASWAYSYDQAGRMTVTV